MLLSESTFRHQLEADVEPFRGILLGLFFLAVGMSLDLAVIAANWRLVAISVVAFMVLKAVGIYAIARLFQRLAPRGAGAHGADDAGRRVRLRALCRGAVGRASSTPNGNAILTAIIIVSMVLTPLMVILHDRLQRARRPSRWTGWSGPRAVRATSC